MEGMPIDPIPVLDKAENGTIELVRGMERAVLEQAPLENAEPKLYLVDPGSMQRSMNEVKAPAMARVELFPPLAFVDVQVIPYDVDVPRRIAFGDRLHEVDYPVTCAPPTLPEDLTRLGIEGCNESARAVTGVLEFIANRVLDVGVSSRVLSLTR